MSDRSGDDARLERILERFTYHSADAAASVGDALCTTSVEVLTVSGAGITLHGPPGSIPYSIGIAGPDMAAIQDLERTLGEGPCVDAFRTGTPSWSADLSDPTDGRWPAFRGEVLRTTARSAFGYPLRGGGRPFGALNLYDTRPRSFSGDQHRDATLIAGVSSHVLLTAISIDNPSANPEAGEGPMRDQDEVHQATGMVAVQLGVPINDALARMRARAFTEGRTINALASDIVNRRTRFER